MQPCDLRDIESANGQRFSCPLLCAVPQYVTHVVSIGFGLTEIQLAFSDEPHERHACDNRMACPVRCELCQRFCAAGDHFHGLDDSLPHLCG